MNKKRFFTFTAVVSFASLFAATLPAQSPTTRQATLKKVVDTSRNLRPEYRSALSAGAQAFLRLAASEVQIDERASSGFSSITSNFTSTPQVTAAATQAPRGTVRVSNPGLDFTDSLLGGFTQNTTSSARCGNSVVVGFMNSRGNVHRRTGGPDGSLSGVAVSSDGGATFTDLGFITSANTSDFLAGDPSVACSNSARFYYATLLFSGAGGNTLSAIAVSSSSTGGKSWANPIVASSTTTGFLDKPWIAVDPINPLRLYLTYTNMDFSPLICPGRVAIELVSSADGGSTWSQPVTVDNECTSPSNVLTGSNVSVSADGRVFVAYELIYPVSGNTPSNEIRFAYSEDGAHTFSTPAKISDVVRNGVFGNAPTGNFGPFEDLKGGFTTNAFPQLAVDRSSAPSRGTLYITWSDGRDRSQRGYNYPDILVAKSTDGGHSFSVPSPVSPTPATFPGAGRDQFFPGIAVDRSGRVAICYYDRRNDPNNLAIDRYCSISTNQAASWQDLRVSRSPWLPFVSSDLSMPIQIGQYDALTTDFLLQSGGFIGAFVVQEDGNPNIVAKAF